MNRIKVILSIYFFIFWEGESIYHYNDGMADGDRSNEGPYIE